MQWLNDFPFGDSRVVQIGILAACGIAALVAVAIVYRVVFAHRLRVPGGRTRQPRLGLVDAFTLDGQRQLVLIRRDNIEHLVMIGGPNDVLVESQINRALAPAREIALTPAPSAAPARKRTEPAAAQPAQSAAPAPASATASVVSPAPPPVVAPPALPAAQVPPARAQTAPSQPAPMASPVGAFPPAPPASDVQPSSSPAPARAAEVPRPGPVAQQQSRSLPPRPSMPPPITPPSAPAGRTATARPAEAHPPAAAPGPSKPTAAKPAAAQPAPHTLDAIAKAVGVAATSAPVQAEPGVRQPSPTKSHYAPSRFEAHAAKPEPNAAKSEAPAARPELNVAPSTPPKAVAFPPPMPPESSGRSEIRPELKVDLVAETPALGDAKPVLTVVTPPSAKTQQKNDDDPFAGLGSLEAEMARLLGRKT